MLIKIIRPALLISIILILENCLVSTKSLTQYEAAVPLANIKLVDSTVVISIETLDPKDINYLNIYENDSILDLPSKLDITDTNYIFNIEIFLSKTGEYKFQILYIKDSLNIDTIANDSFHYSHPSGPEVFSTAPSVEFEFLNPIVKILIPDSVLNIPGYYHLSKNSVWVTMPFSYDLINGGLNYSDSLFTKGLHTYNVYYGSSIDNLSPPATYAIHFDPPPILEYVIPPIPKISFITDSNLVSFFVLYPANLLSKNIKMFRNNLPFSLNLIETKNSIPVGNFLDIYQDTLSFEGIYEYRIHHVSKQGVLGPAKFFKYRFSKESIGALDSLKKIYGNNFLNVDFATNDSSIQLNISYLKNDSLDFKFRIIKNKILIPSLFFKQETDSTNILTYNDSVAYNDHLEYELEYFVNDVKFIYPEIFIFDQDTTSFIIPDRKPPTPIVNMEVELDSHLTFTILGSNLHEETNYWIQKNGALLIATPYYKYIDGLHNYIFTDSLNKIGSYEYEFRYGRSPDSLSDPKIISYDYQGNYYKGTVFIRQINFVLAVRINHGSNQVSNFILQKKIGENGLIANIDTIPYDEYEFVYFDSIKTAVDTTYYFRLVPQDKESQLWLNPTEWVPHAIENYKWEHKPDLSIDTDGKSIYLQINNPVISNILNPVYAFYRSSDSNKNNVELINLDSYIHSPGIYIDQPNNPGDYYYWVQAVDQYKRFSLNSSTLKINFINRYIGPEINSITTGSEILVSITRILDPNITDYIIEKTMDTNSQLILEDTVSLNSPITPFIIYNHRPDSAGVWFYRAKALLNTRETSLWGNWKQSDHWIPVQEYRSLEEENVIIDFGNKVEGWIKNPDTNAVYFLVKSLPLDNENKIIVAESPGNQLNYLQDTTIDTSFSVYWIEKKSLDISLDHVLWLSKVFSLELNMSHLDPKYHLILSNMSINIHLSPIGSYDAVIIDRYSHPANPPIFTDTIINTSAMEAPDVYKDIPNVDSVQWYYRISLLKNDVKSLSNGFQQIVSPWIYIQLYQSLSPSPKIINRGYDVIIEGVSIADINHLTYTVHPESNPIPTLLGSFTDPVSIPFTPPQGINNYWTEAMPIGWKRGDYLLRSTITSIDFTGFISPPNLNWFKYGSYIQLNITEPPYKFQYHVIDITSDTMGSVIFQDTVLDPFYNHRPDSNGSWHYRIQSYTDIGTSRLGDWITVPSWNLKMSYVENQEIAVIHDFGYIIEAHITSSPGQYYKFFRQDSAGQIAAVLVDEIPPGDPKTIFTDLQGSGTYKYWVERWNQSITNSQVEKTHELTVQMDSIFPGPEIYVFKISSQTNYNIVPGETLWDSLQVWRNDSSSFNPDLYTYIKTIPGSGSLFPDAVDPSDSPIYKFKGMKFGFWSELGSEVIPISLGE